MQKKLRQHDNKKKSDIMYIKNMNEHNDARS